SRPDARSGEPVGLALRQRARRGGLRAAAKPLHSACTCASAITLDHLARSAAMRAAASAGDVQVATAPWFNNAALTSGLATMVFRAPFKRSITGAGVPAGATMPNIELTWKFARPASAVVGTSDRKSTRLNSSHVKIS